MILGAAYSQLPLHAAAHKLGHTTIAASIPGSYSCFDVADEKAYVDISDPQAVLAAAKEYRADAVCTCCLDLPMKAIGLVCETLGLSGPSAKAADIVSNKYSMKQALVAAGVKTAPFFCIRTEEELEAAMKQLTFPVILKATDQMGGRGIFKSNTPEEARENFKKSLAASRKDFCLIEQFIEGTLFGVEAMVQNGKLLFIMPDNTEIFAGATNIPVGHSVPLHDFEKHGETAIREVTKAISATGLDNCPVNCDCILSGDDVYIVEITGRSGATGLSEIVSLRYDIDYYQVILRLALGEDVQVYFSTPKEKAVLTHTLTAPREGILRRIINHSLPAGAVKELSFNIEPGDHIRPFTNGIDRIGQIIITADSPDECRKILENTEAHLTYELEGDLPLMESPIEEITRAVHQLSWDPYCGVSPDLADNNRFYIKREDLIPYSHGGNKVRFADAYLKDMAEKGCDAMIIFGNISSNLCRILSQACNERGIPCSFVNNIDDVDPEEESANARMIRSCITREYPCRKQNIADVVETAMNDFTAAGYKPYYIHGNKFGQGGAMPPVASYADVYFEILKQERETGRRFDYIFLASSTNASQSGLIAGQLLAKAETEKEGTFPPKKIVGISVNRKKERATEVIRGNLTEFVQKNTAFSEAFRNSDEWPALLESEICLEDAYLSGGYGIANEQIRAVSRRMYETTGLKLDWTYTAKAFTGMLSYLEENGISGKDILFIHTGGTVLFRE